MIRLFRTVTETKTGRRAGRCLMVACLALLCLTRPGMAEEVSSGTSMTGSGEIPDWQARLELARILSYSKKYAESLDQYRKVLADKPDVIEAKAEMALVQLWSGNASEAMREFSGLPIDRLDGKTRMAFVDLIIAAKQYDTAKLILRDHLKKSAEDLEARLKLADILSWTKEYDASIAEFRQILEKRPDDAQVRRRLANVLTWANRKSEAIEELKKSLGEK